MDSEHFLALADGTVFFGRSCGAPRDAEGEAVFNTGHTGYQEIVSDPSYAGQTVVLSAPEIGNYGCRADEMQSRGLFLSGLVVRRMNPPSNARSEEPLTDLLRRFNVPALTQVDTRGLVLHLRRAGSQRSYLHCSDWSIQMLLNRNTAVTNRSCSLHHLQSRNTDFLTNCNSRFRSCRPEST